MRYYLLLVSGFIIATLYSCSSSKPVTATRADSIKPTQQQGNFQKGETWTAGDMEFSDKFLEALRQEYSGNNQQAISLLNECLLLKPNNAPACYELAKIYYSQQKYDAALNYAKVPDKDDPDNEWYVQQYADALAETNNFKDAAAAYGDYIKRHPDNTDRYFDWAYYLTKAEQYDDAIKAYDDLEARVGLSKDISEEKERLYLKLGKVDKAIDEVNKLIAANPNDPSYYAMLADLYSANNMDDKAMDALQKLIQIDPDNPQAQLALSDYYTKKGEGAKAFDALKSAFVNMDLELDTKVKILFPYLTAMQKDSTIQSQALILGSLLAKTYPLSAKAHAMYGDLLNQVDHNDSALVQYKKSIACDSSKFLVWQELMYLDSKTGRIDSLLKDSKRALNLFPDQVYAYYFNGIANMQKKQYQAVVDVFSKGVKVGSDDKQLMGEMYADLGDAYNNLRNYGASDSAFEQSLTYDPASTYTLNNYAYYISERGGDLNKADQMAKKANEFAAGNASFEDTYAWVLYKEKKYSDAKTWEEKAIQDGASKDATVLDHYGNILYQLGDTDNAVKYWKMAKDLHLDSAVIDKKITDRKLYE